MEKIIHTVGNKVDIPKDDDVAKHKFDNQIIFVGKMSYEPNIVAVTYFANFIFPKLKEIIPDLRFTIIGANPDNRVYKLREISGVEITGFVDSVEPYFQNSTIVVAPMLTGAGIQNKIIQAMSYGCCVATTSIGAEGLSIENNEIAIFGNEQDWIEGLSILLKNRDLRREMGVKARNYVIEHLSNNIIAKQFWNFINSVKI